MKFDYKLFRMSAFIAEIQEAIPGIFVHSIQIGSDPDQDRSYTFFDNVNRQIDEVCEQLQGIPELSGGFNAIGLSQVAYIRDYPLRVREDNLCVPLFKDAIIRKCII